MLSISATALLLSLACGIGYSASDYFRKAVPATCSSSVLMFYFAAGQMPVLAAYLVWDAGYRITGAYWLPGLVDAAFGLAANLFFVAAVRRSPLSLMIPLLALVPVFTAFAGDVFLDEALTERQMIGGGLVIAGLFLLFVPPEGAQSPPAFLKGLGREPGLKWMLATAACWSVTPVLDKIAVAESSVSLHGLLQLMSIVLATGAWVMARQGLHGLRIPAGAGRPLAGSAIAGGFAYLFQLAAYVATMVALVELIKRVTGIVGSLVIGRVMFGETLTVPKLAGIVVILTGLPLVILT